MAFKTAKRSSISLESPEAMFYDIKSRRIEGLLSQQADILRDYASSAVDEADVALQLPTGSGKTLIGLLVAEWRRRRFDERAIYLCPTRQLVNQVTLYAGEHYGVRAEAFTGSHREFDQAAAAEWQAGEVLGITTYSSLFNVNPFFDGPHLIILDDIHAAEDYIADHWTLEIPRANHRAAFEAITSVLKPILSRTDYMKLSRDPGSLWEFSWIDMAPLPELYHHLPALVATLDEYVAGTELRYAWSVLRDHLEACHLYLSAQAIVIRPFIPPTSGHAPFCAANQRVYMSATLGEGGELERLTGRRTIRRLAVPADWSRHGVGRRFFVFPGRSLDEDGQEELLTWLVARAGRTLYLVPSERSAEGVRAHFAKFSYKIFGAREIEASKMPFIEEQHAVAVIANRYDGIDFPRDECRLLVIDGLPRATNLQERFLIGQMGGVVLFHDRIRTRIVQAFGRCTRSSTDYSAVVVCGEELLTYLMKKEGRQYLHPELQAELRFGMDQSTAVVQEEFRENFELFLRQGPEWAAADEEIVGLRATCFQQPLPCLEILRRTASLEVECVEAAWRGNFLGALEKCRAILAELAGPELRGYAAFWNYVAGCAAWLATQHGMAALEEQARTYFRRASGAVPVPWLARLSMERQGEPAAVGTAYDPKLLALIQRMEQKLEELGTIHDRKFAAEERAIREGLMSDASTEFERAHEHLGLLLGYDAGNRETPGAPDPWWLVDSSLCFIFEDHSEASEDSTLSVKKARQVASHRAWARAELPVDEDAEIQPILVTPVLTPDSDAIPHVSEVYLWPIADFRTWASDALGLVRELRVAFPGAGDLAWRSQAADRYVEHLGPDAIKARLIRGADWAARNL